MAFNFGLSESFIPSGAMEAGMDLFLIIYLVMMAGVTLFGLVCYVFECLGLYTIAKRRRIHHAWLSWIPVGSEWILGSIADQYQYVVKNKVCSRRKVMLVLNALVCVLSVLQISAGIMLAIHAYQAVDAEQMTGILGPGAAIGFMSTALTVIALVAAVFRYIALYDLFTSCDPDTKVVFLVLGILFNFLVPFFLFADRKKDNGMPPRIDEISGEIPQYAGESHTEFL